MRDNKIRLSTALFLAAIVFMGGWTIFKKYTTGLYNQSVASFAQGDLVSAEDAAARLGWFDKKKSIYMLAVIEIANSMASTGRQRDVTLDRALAALEKQGPYRENNYWVLWTKAALASLLGNAAKVKEYFHEACDLNSKEIVPNDEVCLSDVYRSSRRAIFRSSSLRNEASRFYQVIEVADVVGGIDHDELAFDRVLIMIAFNKDKAIRMRDELAKEGKMTPERVGAFEKLMQNSEKPLPQIM
ncbi:hypothetical protein [Dyella sp.]|uniref:hypothetical protein n=1 Tax=Dyella sp. TaxID=1869338 RepID=UPI002B462B80|nr:hypothetical protein [Dyella sp.]HKT29312.1 hypothetical protein [Dyella sp.]